ncbi:hypothetical protein JTB14_009781 [Gonioctena quinquepunctata]|nr:hypothetical protein JTB14_009781 [Gonioctena quinquepunctata]
MATRAVLVAELNKLKKNDLIDIIINFKVPVSLTNPQVISYIRKIGDHIDTESEKSHNSVEDVICARCEKVSGNNSSLKKELETVSKLSYHLEKRCQEQEDLIYLLKQLNNGLNSKTLVAPSTSNRVNSTIQNDRSSEVSTEKGENVISEAKQNNQMRSQQKLVTNKQGNSQTIYTTDVRNSEISKKKKRERYQRRKQNNQMRSQQNG